MKVCEKCGDEIGGRDADNRCEPCEEGTRRKSRKGRLTKREKDAMMRLLGLVRVVGEMGGVYWE